MGAPLPHGGEGAPASSRQPATMPPVPAPRLGGETLWHGVDGGSIAVEMRGSGAPLILLHGWTLDRRMWAAQADALASRHRLICIDRRGFGQSTAPADLSAEADDVLSLADRLGLDRFSLVGMSQAGAPAIALALNHPDRVRALVLQGVSVGGLPAPEDPKEVIPLAAYAARVAAGEIEAVRRDWATHPLMAGLDGQAAATAGQMLADYDGRDLLAGPARSGATIADIEALAMPVLAITGSDDTDWRVAVTSAVGARAKAGRAVLIPGAGHMCNLSNPAAYNRALLDFLAPSPAND